MKRYFVLFSFTLLDGKQGISNMETEIVGNINCLNDIRAIEQKVLEDNPNYKDVIVTNYREF